MHIDADVRMNHSVHQWSIDSRKRKVKSMKLQTARDCILMKCLFADRIGRTHLVLKHIVRFVGRCDRGSV